MFDKTACVSMICLNIDTCRVSLRTQAAQEACLCIHSHTHGSSNCAVEMSHTCIAADLHDVNVWKAHNAADKAAAAAAAAAGSAEADEAEALLEQQLEQMLDEGAHHDDDSLMDDYFDSDEPSSTASGDTDSDSNSDSGKAHTGTAKGHPQKQKQQQQSGGKHGVQAVAEPPPPSFSGVQLDLPQSELRQRFPRFPGLAAASVVVLQAGDMLYLPAGWFHEVTSYGGPGEGGWGCMEGRCQQYGVRP